METSEYHEIHKIVLNIYIEFQKICKKNNLRFFAISGTTLGAVLWEGIIPWDDDIDIAMPMPDYEEFVKICKKSLPDYLAFSEYIWFGGKLHDRRTTFTNINYIHDSNRYNGIFIDIVPLIALPDNPEQRLNFIQDVKNFQKFGILFDRYKDHEYTKSQLYAWRRNILTKYNFGDTQYVMDFSDPRYVLESKGFLQPSIVKFEKTTIPISSNALNDLSIQYGKYEKYPPKSKRQSIHENQSILDSRTPYEKYANDFTKLPSWIQSLFEKKNTNEGAYLKNLYYTQDLLTKEQEQNKTLNKNLENTKEQLQSCKKQLSETQQQLAKTLKYRIKSFINSH